MSSPYSRDGTSPDAPVPVSPRRALFALGVAAVGTVAFVIGLRAALRRLPPEHPARPAAVDSTYARRLTRPPSPPTQPDEYPRLR